MRQIVLSLSAEFLKWGRILRNWFCGVIGGIRAVEFLKTGWGEDYRSSYILYNAG